MPAAKLMEIAQSSDPREGLLSAVGDLSKINVLSGRVLVAIYIAPEALKSGINDKGEKFQLLRTQAAVKEDVWQGCVGLVLKKGAMAFKDDEINKFHGQDVKVGEWVTFRPGDAKRIQLNGVDCRIVEDTVLDMVIDDPEIVTHQK